MGDGMGFSDGGMTLGTEAGGGRGRTCPYLMQVNVSFPSSILTHRLITSRCSQGHRLRRIFDASSKGRTPLPPAHLIQCSTVLCSVNIRSSYSPRPIFLFPCLFPVAFLILILILILVLCINTQHSKKLHTYNLTLAPQTQSKAQQTLLQPTQHAHSPITTNTSSSSSSR